MLFSKIVQEYRIREKLTLREFGEVIGFSHTTVSDWEKNNYEPNPITLFPLVLTKAGWVRDFALDCMAALQPDLYQPAGEIGQRLLQAAQEMDP